MRIVSIGGVPAHKREESEELAMLVAQFNNQTGEQVRGAFAPAEPVEPAKLPTPIGPHFKAVSDERSVVIELRAIRAEARRLMARLPDAGQARFE